MAQKIRKPMRPMPATPPTTPPTMAPTGVELSVSSLLFPPLVPPPLLPSLVVVAGEAGSDVDDESEEEVVGVKFGGVARRMSTPPVA